MVRNQNLVKCTRLLLLVGAASALLLAASLITSLRAPDQQPVATPPSDNSQSAHAEPTHTTQAANPASSENQSTQAEPPAGAASTANTPWQQALANSNHPDDWVLKVIIEHTDQERKEQHLLQAYRHQPSSLLVNFHLLTHCIEQPSSSLCSLPFEQTLLVSDGSNVYTLMNLALYQAAAGNHARALHYLQQSAASSIGEDYVVKHLVAMDQSQKRHQIERSLNTVAENLTLAVAATVPDFRELFGLCDTLVASQGSQGSRLCQNLGLQLQKQSKNLLDRATGGAFSFRYASLPESQNDAHIQQLHKQTQSDFVALEVLDGLFDQHAESLIPDHAWHNFTELYKSRNEVAASWYLAGYIIESEQQYAILY